MASLTLLSVLQSSYSDPAEQADSKSPTSKKAAPKAVVDKRTLKQKGQSIPKISAAESAGLPAVEATLKILESSCRIADGSQRTKMLDNFELTKQLNPDDRYHMLYVKRQDAVRKAIDTK